MIIRFSTYYARTDPDHNCLPHEPGCRWQRLREHLVMTARIASQLAARARPNDTSFYRSAKWAALLHDIGKYSDGFAKLLHARATDTYAPASPHSPYGAAISSSYRAYDIALAVLGHHSGLHAATELTTKLSHIKGTGDELLDRAVADGLKVVKRMNLSPPSVSDKLKFELTIRMLASCLIDADRLDCLRHETNTLQMCSELNSDSLFQRLMDHISAKANGAKEGVVKDARQTVLKACLERAGDLHRLWSLTVPTGGGKTLSSMAFALKRAVERSEEVRRIIVVIPYLSIIEQNASELEEALGKDVVLEHHSGDYDDGFDGETDTALTGEKRQLSLARENWDAPVVVTTSVRFFDSLFSNKPRDLRRLHNIARSVVILDEVQTLPRRLLAPILSVIEDLSENWQTTFLFCTATQPAFERKGEHDPRLAEGSIKSVLPLDVEKNLFTVLKRVADPVWPEQSKLEVSELASELLSNRQVLCIVNKKKQALELYEEMKGKGNVFHLSTAKCPAHRLDTLKQIKSHLQNNEPCIVVSTQLVEAGVDIDFPVVYRAVAPLDAMIQAAGRCDREGKITAQTGEPGGRLVIFRLDDDQLPYGDEFGITESMIATTKLSIHNPEHTRIYFDRLYSGDIDVKTIQGLRRTFNYPKVAAEFAMIDDQTKSVLVQYGRGKDLIADIAGRRQIDRTTLRRVARYQVGLRKYEFDRGRQVGAIVPLWSDAPIYVCSPSCYCVDTGIKLVEPTPTDYIM